MGRPNHETVKQIGFALIAAWRNGFHKPLPGDKRKSARQFQPLMELVADAPSGCDRVKKSGTSSADGRWVVI